MKRFKYLVQYLLLIFLTILILYVQSKRNNISKNIISFFSDNKINFVWLLVLNLLFLGFFIWKDWDKIKNYNDLNIIDKMQTTALILMAAIIFVVLVEKLMIGVF